MKPRTVRKPSSKASHGIPFAEGDPGLRPDVAGRHAKGTRSARLGREPAGRQDRVEEREAKRGQDRRGAEVALDPLEDGAQADQLPPRVEVEQLVGQALGAGHDREAGEQAGAHRLGADIGRGPSQVVGVERRLALLRATALVAADRAAVVPGRRPGPPGDPRLVVDRPGDLVDDERPAAGRAAGREQVADRDLETRRAARRGGHPLERGVEVADVGRAQDDLGEHPRQRVRLDRDRQALAVDGGPRDPAATAEQVGDDIAGSRVLLDPGGHHRGRRRGRDPVEDRKREARPGIEGSTSGHQADASRRAIRLADARPADRTRDRSGGPAPSGRHRDPGAAGRHRRRAAGDPRRRARAPLALAAVRHRRARCPLRALSRPRMARIGDRGDRHRARRRRRVRRAGRTGDPGARRRRRSRAGSCTERWPDCPPPTGTPTRVAASGRCGRRSATSSPASARTAGSTRGS